MPAPQGLILFDGINSLLSASYTLGLGTAPSIATLRIAPQPDDPLPEIGTLSVQYGNESITFPDAKIVELRWDIGDDGSVTWALSIADCRWRWRYATISGEYNTPRPEPKQLPRNLKKPQELARMLFKELGFDRPDVSQLPNDTYPHVQWDFTRVDNALSELCDGLGCRVALTQRNQVKIVKVGQGQSLPKNMLLGGGQAIQPPDLPDEIWFVCGPSLFQQDLQLEPVMMDRDGIVKRANDISYKPREGWDSVDSLTELFPGDNDGEKAINNLFAQTFCRWFRVYSPVNMNFHDLQNIAAFDIYRLLPLNSHQLRKQLLDPAKAKDAIGAFAQQQQDEKNWDTYEAWVFGVFWGGNSKSGNNVDDANDALVKDPNPDLDKKPKGIYRGSWELDAEHGIVKFADPVRAYVNNKNVPGKTETFPKLWLRTSFSFKDGDEYAPKHFIIKRKLPGKKKGTKPLVIYRPDVVAKYIYVGINGNVIQQSNNEDECTKAANQYIDLAIKKLQIDTPATADYAGFTNIDPDGAIQQVTWNVDESGAARTTIARNTEQLIRTPSYEEIRHNQKVVTLLADAAKGK